MGGEVEKVIKYKHMKKFISGLDICEQFFLDLIEPLLENEYPKLKYSAALIGPGSEVLGFDTPISTDHDWRPRVFIFLSDADAKKYGKKIERLIRSSLPKHYKSYALKADNDHDLRSRYVYSVNSFVKEYLAFDLKKKPHVQDWLTFDEHKLLGLTSGRIFRDDTGELKKMRKLFSYFPKQVWLYLLASEWKNIAEEESFVGRTGDVGDEIGSRVITTRLIQSIMRLCFMMEKTYAPYSKWFGSGFNRLETSKKMRANIAKTLNAENWKGREKYLIKLYAHTVNLHNKLGITKAMNTRVRLFHGRPYKVINAHDIAGAIQNKITDKNLKGLPLVGSINQITNSVPLLEGDDIRLKAITLFKK